MKKAKEKVTIINEKTHTGGMQQLVESVKDALELADMSVEVKEFRTAKELFKTIWERRGQVFFWSFYGDLSFIFILFSFLCKNKNVFLSYGPIVDPMEIRPHQYVAVLKKKVRNFFLVLNHFLFLFFSHKIMHISEYEKKLLETTWPYSLIIYSKNRKIIYPALCQEKSKQFITKRQARNFLGYKEEGMLLICIGRLERRKNIEDAIEVLKRIHEQGFENAYFTYLFPHSFYSDFEYLIDLTALVKKYGLGRYVHFASGFTRNEVKYLYKSADLFLMPSLRFESFGFVTLESLMYSCPVFGYDNCATPEIILDQRSRFLVGDGKPDSLANLIVSYLKLNANEKKNLLKKFFNNKLRFSVENMSRELALFI